MRRAADVLSWYCQVHIVGGTVGLVATTLLGPRRFVYRPTLHHCVPTMPLPRPLTRVLTFPDGVLPQRGVW